jgi:hypothetical protein
MSRRVTRTLNTAPAVPEIIATKTKHTKSQRIAVTKSKKKQVQEDCYTGVHLRAKTETFGTNTHHPPEHPHNKLTSNTNARHTVEEAPICPQD